MYEQTNLTIECSPCDIIDKKLSVSDVKSFAVLSKNCLKVQDSRECRICLEVSGQDFVAPCRCIGSIRFVHEKCLTQWIKKKMAKTRERIACELCLEPYPYELRVYKEFDCGHFVDKIKQNLWQSILFFFCYFSFFAGSILFAVMLTRAHHEPADGELRQKMIPSANIDLILSTLVALCFMCLTVTTVLFLAEYWIREILDIEIISVQQASTRRVIQRQMSNYRPKNYKIGQVAQMAQINQIDSL